MFFDTENISEIKYNVLLSSKPSCSVRPLLLDIHIKFSIVILDLLENVPLSLFDAITWNINCQHFVHSTADTAF